MANGVFDAGLVRFGACEMRWRGRGCIGRVDVQAAEGAKDIVDRLLRLALLVDQMLNTGQLVFHCRGNLGVLDENRQDVLPGFGGQRKFLGDVLRLKRRGTGKQDEHLAALDRVDDLLAPQLGPVNPLVVDPDLQPFFAQLFNDREHLLLI